MSSIGIYSPLGSESPPDLDLFRSWLHDHEVYLHPFIELKHDESSGWGISSCSNISRGEIFCGIPRSLIFSAQTASLQRSIEAETAADLILHLTACLLHELRLGRESRWYGWLQFVPRDVVRIPALWADGDIGGKGDDGQRGLEWLTGTEALAELEKKDQEGLSLTDLQNFYASLELPPTSDHPVTSPISSFLYAYSLVSSRGFAIDTYHSIGLIPFCDMFNHSSSTPHTSLSVDPSVCETCGSLLLCSHDPPDSDRLHHLSEVYLSQLEKEGMADKVDMRAQVEIPAGGQVYSCYDESINNAKLLVDYGFTEELNTSISWSFRQIMDPSLLRLFMGILQSQVHETVNGEPEGLVGQPSEDQPEPLVLRPDGKISRNLLIALYLKATVKTELEEISDELESVLDAVIHQPPRHQGTGTDIETVISCTAELLVELFRARIGGLHRSDVSLEELKETKKVRRLHKH